jgi:hypothetical protein
LRGTKPAFEVGLGAGLRPVGGAPAALGPASYLRRMRLPRLLLTPWLLHLLVWLGFAVYEQSVLLFSHTSQFDLVPTLLNYLLNAALFYTNSSLLLPYFYARRQWAYYVLAALAALAGYALLRSELYLDLVPALELLKLAAASSYRQFWILSLYRGSFFLFVSLGYWFARNALALETQKREQAQQLRATERSLMEANLAFLKSQINPHFLFNSLNFLYAQVYPHSENAARGILLLSDTMRYALHEDNNGKVMLTQEVQHLHNYIALNQLRFNNQLQVDFTITGNPQFLLILPLVLITFVENCFKHGELADPANPLVISLSLTQNILAFQTRNKKRDGPKEKSTGIGLSNTRQRLDIVYPGRYKLLTINDADYYTCTLTIEL